jgi:heat shock protein HslJ
MAKTGWFGLAAIALGIVMAGSVSTGADEPDRAGLTGTTWRAEIIMGRRVIDASASTITFESDGRVHGRGGCNRYFGSSTIDGEQVSFSALGSTKMACAPALMEQEARFFQALESAERWTIDQHGLLLIHSAGGDQPSRFAPFKE